MPHFKKVEGKKVYLSPIDQNDAAQYAKWLNDLLTSINLTVAPQVLSLEQERSILEEMAKSGYHFSIVRRDDDGLVGNCSLMSVDLIQGSGELGVFIGDEENRGKGYGGEAVRLILSYAFDLLNLHSVYLRVRSFNENAAGLYKKLGFKEIGRRRECVLVAGTYYDEIYMDILDREFRENYGRITRDLKGF